MSKLTDKQQRFVDEYLVDYNATQAAIRAGYNLSDEIPVEGWYVYLLVDSRDEHIFYVGKGKGKRMLRHESLSEKFNHPKTKIINELKQQGQKVVSWVFECFHAESKAFSCEKILIQRLKEYGLTNIVMGVVTKEEAVRNRGETILGKLKPKDEWLEVLSAEDCAQIERVCQISPDKLYDKIIENIYHAMTLTSNEYACA